MEKILTILDFQEIFKCGKNKAYAIMHDKYLKSFRIGKTYFVVESDLINWLERAKRLSKVNL